MEVTAGVCVEVSPLFFVVDGRRRGDEAGGIRVVFAPQVVGKGRARPGSQSGPAVGWLDASDRLAPCRHEASRSPSRPVGLQKRREWAVIRCCGGVNLTTAACQEWNGIATPQSRGWASASKWATMWLFSSCVPSWVGWAVFVSRRGPTESMWSLEGFFARGGNYVGSIEFRLLGGSGSEGVVRSSPALVSQ